MSIDFDNRTKYGLTRKRLPDFSGIFLLDNATAETYYYYY